MLVSTRVWFILDRHGWPIETIKGHTFHNLLRTLLLGRRVVHTTAVVELPMLGQRNRRRDTEVGALTINEHRKKLHGLPPATWPPGTVDPRVGTLPQVEPPEPWERKRNAP